MKGLTQCAYNSCFCGTTDSGFASGGGEWNPYEVPGKSRWAYRPKGVSRKCPVTPRFRINWTIRNGAAPAASKATARQQGANDTCVGAALGMRRIRSKKI